MANDRYEEPLVGRYTSREMQRIFSNDFKFRTWRRCWIALAEAQQELGLKDSAGNPRITDEMIAEMKAAQTIIDYEVADAKEREIRHDVMAHVYEFGAHCPKAKEIIHLGATSMFPCDNTELIQQREAMEIVKTGLVNVIKNMADIAYVHRDMVCLGYTHYQPALPTTIGKRFALYIQDLLMDLETIESLKFRARGAKGTTGTQNSFIELFDGDYSKVKALDDLVCKKLGFDDKFVVTGQTYPRKFDAKVAEAIAGIGVSLAKFGTDMRLLANLKCVDEPFKSKQTGSSAMPFKRNPMRLERLCGLSLKPRSLVADFYSVAASQWFERTLDDSAIRRMDIPQLYLSADAMLILARDITGPVPPEEGMPLTFYRNRLLKLVFEELPFMASETIMMDLVRQGHDRQVLHKIIEGHSHAVGRDMKDKGADNDLFDRLAADPEFPMGREQLQHYLEHPLKFAGCASVQVEEYIADVVMPVLERCSDRIGQGDAKVKV